MTAGGPTAAKAQDATPDSTDRAAASGEEAFYEIGTDDLLSIDVRGEPELSNEYLVRPDGRISMPLIGDVEAVGQMPEALADTIEERLARYLTDPQATVTVARATGTIANRIRIIGGALVPRSLPYNKGMTALDAVLAIGGLPETADGNDAYILRRTEDGNTRQVPIKLEDLEEGRDPGANRTLKPGDTIVVPESFLAGDWRVQPFATSRITYTDNVDLDPDDQKEDALITEVGPGVSFEADTARLQAALEGSLLYERTSLNQEEDDIRAELAGTATAEWVENLFWTDAAASVSQQTIDSSRGTSSNVSNDASTEMVQTYRLSPYLTNRLGRYVFTELRYAGTVTLVEDDEDTNDTRLRPGSDASNSIEHQVSFTARSGPRFDRYSWTATALASELNFEGDGGDSGFGNDSDQSRREAVLRNRYALTRSFALIGDIGYQKLESDDPTDSFEAPLYAAGFQWTPSPDTDVLATYGQRNNNLTLELDARHDVSARTTLTASYEQEVATGQQRLANRLPGTIQDVQTRDPETGRFSISDETTLTDTAEVGAETRIGRNTFRLTGTYRTVQEDVEDGETNEESIGGRFTFVRPLSRVVEFSSFVGYEYVEFDDLRGINSGETVEDDNYRGGLNLSYTGFQDITLSAGYTYSRRDSTAPNDDYVENAFTVSGRIDF
ncbi:TIGR03016 family PEP-CTERM system-associated outer membrane protein [Rhodovibrio salinarum]|uniref:TIGR03016 family PEP-CTERM system-associated outer membrane protein n=1 Tax=Rhodovibrio salinarum TaxID=1087 RepID=A0A934UYQ0_9PROT|nr:TIGR03016 family PEP-CTERM system-associated outer membrane protein [Rhodovibrio salinarum]MBK1696028.1 TIGR03016 family PEP-CTERM system-associated outer membrane protein [Rhodovibrio salinarum]